jgi:hypothetical protein
MNKTEGDKIHELCSRIAVEQDYQKFLAMVEELDCILSARDKSFHPSEQTKSKV